MVHKRAERSDAVPESCLTPVCALGLRAVLYLGCGLGHFTLLLLHRERKKGEEKAYEANIAWNERGGDG